MPSDPPCPAAAATATTVAPAADAAPLNAPRSRADLFWSFTWLALQGFGGVLAVVQREMVEKKCWMTREQFIEDWAVAQIMPGPNVANLSMMVGDRSFGLSGAIAAISGMLLFPTMIVLAMATAFATVADHPVAQGALRGMGAVAAGLIMATGIKLISALRTNVMGTTACAVLALATFGVVALWRLPLAWALLIVGGPACVWAWWCLGTAPPAQPSPPEAATAATDPDSGQTPQP
ncbi:chromate transporter [Ottowia sp.]|uniref:chromate transporter n=1 Tax=Ottowia sp. TaxID=1898956 RepID=UPI003A83545C